MVFLPKEHASRLACTQELERAVKAEGQVVLGWRDVPVDAEMPMSPAVRAKEPVLRQIFIGRGPDVIVPDALERKLYVIRKTASSAIQALKLTHSREYYVPSMSCRTVIYKGLLLANQVGKYYKDLADPRLTSALALVHQRFSTNTFPEWPLAHPYRMVAHNGEINTVKGNFNWMRAREGVMKSPVLGDDLKKLYPITFEGQSDTATFDNALELLTMSGYSLAHAVMMMIPEAWEQHTEMDARRRAFYEYHAAMMEPWDGPAAMVFTDGRQIGATLDRNGLRPARYIVTDDGLVVMASETGVLPIAENRIVKKWRLQPGKMFLIDFEQGPHRRRRGAEESVRVGQAVSPVGRQRSHQARGPAARARAGRVRREPARSPAGLRLHAGRHQVPDEPDGAGRRGRHRLDGQRLAARRALGQEQAALQLLQAAVRAGDESADRSDPRIDRDVAGLVHRPEAGPARHQRGQPADAARGRAADPRRRRHDAAALDRGAHRRQVQELRDRHHLSARLGRGRRRGQARLDVRGERRRDQKRATTS
jgi:glutamate synthase domain-containing protein 1